MTVLILEPEGFPAAALDRLRAVGPVVVGADAPGAESAEAIFVRLATVLDTGFHARYPALRWIVSPTTGLNHIDLDYFADAGVEVISLRGRVDFLDHIHATAEHTLTLALSLLRRLPSAVADVAAGRWDRYPFKGRELHGKTVLLLGYGRIGRMVAPLYTAFGCHVRAVDIVPGRVPDTLACTLDSALADTDILSIHLPLVAETEGYVDAAMLGRLPERAVVVNTARGEVIDQPALFAALEAGALAGAALDVLWQEPAPIDEELRGRLARLDGRLLLTPHIGGFTHESLEAVETFITDVFIDAAHPR